MIRPKIRRARQEDAPAVERLLVEHGLPLMPASFQANFDAAKTSRFIAESMGTTIVADAGGDIVGVMLSRVACPWFSNRRVLRGVAYFVREDARVSRTGYRLLKATLQAARDHELAFVLEVTSGNDILRKDAFLTRIGMQSIGGTYIFGG